MWKTIWGNQYQSAIKTWNKQEKTERAGVSSEGQVFVASWVPRAGKVVELANKGGEEVEAVFVAAEKAAAVTSVKTVSQSQYLNNKFETSLA